MFYALLLSFSILNYLLPPTAWSVIPDAQFPSKHYIIHIHVMHTNTKHIFSAHIFFSLWTYPLMYPKRSISFVKICMSHKNNFFLQQSWFWLVGMLGLNVSSYVRCCCVHCSLSSCSLICDLGHKSVSTLHVDCGLYVLCIHSIW